MVSNDYWMDEENIHSHTYVILTHTQTPTRTFNFSNGIYIQFQRGCSNICSQCLAYVKLSFRCINYTHKHTHSQGQYFLWKPQDYPLTLIEADKSFEKNPAAKHISKHVKLVGLLRFSCIVRNGMSVRVCVPSTLKLDTVVFSGLNN